MKPIALLSLILTCFCVYGAEMRSSASLPKALLDKKTDSPVGTPGRKKSDSPVGTPGRKVESFDQLKREIEQKKSEQREAQLKANPSEKK